MILLTIVGFSEKEKTTLMKPLTFWKWKHISKKTFYILKMKEHFKKDLLHFENESTFQSICLYVPYKFKMAIGIKPDKIW